MSSNDDARESRSDDDAHDHIGSQSATPSGARTPRPDLQDKRLPGIAHAFFGQVGNTESSSTSQSQSQSSSISLLSPEKNQEIPMSHNAPGLSMHAPPTAPSTPGRENESHLPVEELDGVSPSHRQLQTASHGLPTPPVSSASSMTQKESDGSDRSCSTERPRAKRDSSPLKQGAGNSSVERFPMGSHKNAADLETLPGVVTSSTVHASDIAQATAASTRTSSSSSCSHSPLHMQASVTALSSCLESVKLTRGVAPASRKKNTPPLTPRALSSSTHPDGPTKPSVSSPRSSNQTNDEFNSNSSHDETRRDSYIELPPTKEPRGKLSMKISQGRGLKPSFDPYVVCFFEWNEYITRGPKQVEEEAKRSESRTREELFGGVAIQRTGSDFGRSIAIPMKSRQGSSTSISEARPAGRPGQQVTDPKWDIEATL